MIGDRRLRRIDARRRGEQMQRFPVADAVRGEGDDEDAVPPDAFRLRLERLADVGEPGGAPRRADRD